MSAREGGERGRECDEGLRTEGLRNQNKHIILSSHLKFKF